jgi:hypothetical protein
MDFKVIKKSVLYDDWTLRDICIENSEKIDWYKIIILLEENKIKYLLNWKESNLESTMLNVSNYFINIEKNSLNLSIYIWSMQINWFFMLWNWDIFDINPLEILDKANFEKLYNFLSNISKILNKKLYITEEGEFNKILLNII